MIAVRIYVGDVSALKGDCHTSRHYICLERLSDWQPGINSVLKWTVFAVQCIIQCIYKKTDFFKQIVEYKCDRTLEAFIYFLDNNGECPPPPGVSEPEEEKEEKKVVFLYNFGF